MTDENADVIARLLARAEAAEKERDEAMEALSSEAGMSRLQWERAERAEARADNLAPYVARCATLQAALREARDWIAEEDDMGDTPDYRGSLLNRLDRALAAATPPAEKEGTP